MKMWSNLIYNPKALSVFLIVLGGLILTGTGLSFGVYAQEGLNLPGGDVISFEEVQAILVKITNWLMSVGVVIAIIFLAWGAIKWMAAGGSEDRLKSAKATVKNGIIGVIILYGIGVILRTAEGLIYRTFFG